MKGKGHSPKNARGFQNLEIGSLISFCYEYNSDKDELAEDPLFIEINDIVKAQFRQMNQYRNKTTKLITYEKVCLAYKNRHTKHLCLFKSIKRG